MQSKIPYDLSSLAFSSGCIPLLFFVKLPSIPVRNGIIILLFLIAISAFCSKSNLRIIVGFFIAGLLWSTTSATQFLAGIERYIDQTMMITASVKSINTGYIVSDNHQDGQYIDFTILTINQQPISDSLTVSLLWKNRSIPHAGERWQLKIKTKVVHSYLNQGGFDNQRFAIANRRLLSGTIQDATIIDKTSNIRQMVVNKAAPYFNLFEYGDVMFALAFGERSQLTELHKMMMLQTGIAHLMAISGMHILLVVYLCARSVRAIQYFLPVKLMTYWLPTIVGFCAAGFYAWLSGLNPPVIRAMLALSMWLILRYRKTILSPWQIINRVIAILLLFDPLMILSESFWLSCYAVVCLIIIRQWHLQSDWLGHKIDYLRQLFTLQCLLTLLLLPIQFFIFGGISFVTILANLITIPIISFYTFPCILLLLVTSMLNCFYVSLWFGVLAQQSLALLFLLLKPITGYWFGIANQFYFFSIVGWLALFCRQTAFWRSRTATFLLIIMCIFSPLFKRSSHDWRVDMLDIGHGLAVVISQGRSAVLYDTGASWQNTSAAQRIILPFLTWHNLNVEGIIISHEHNDHIGGLNFIKTHFPDAWLMSSSTKLPNDYDCINGHSLAWHGLQFSVLWPLAMNQAAFNAESCVVKVTLGTYSLLLTGDLERAQEENLVLMQKNRLFSTILQMPHHGSNTSSYYAFLAHVKPEMTLGSVSRYDPWKLPSNKALNRYNDLKLNYSLTQESGQITIYFYPENWVIERMRYEIKPRWYHDWFGALPIYR